MNIKNLVAGICFLIGAILCVSALIKDGYVSFYAVGVFVFTFAGIAFIRNCRR